MAILWDVRVQGGEGKELYGKDYSDIWAINRMHFMAASGYECDHVSRHDTFLSSSKITKKAVGLVETPLFSRK